MSSEMGCMVTNVTVYRWRQEKVTKNTPLSSSANRHEPDPKAWRYFWRHWGPTRSHDLFLAVKWTQDHKRVKSIDSQQTDVEIPFHFRNVMSEETLIGEDCCRTRPDTTTLLVIVVHARNWKCNHTNSHLVCAWGLRDKLLLDLILRLHKIRM